MIPLVVFALVYWGRRHRNESANANYLQDAIESGLTEPSSMHPAIDEALCIGCGSCVSACPEKKVLGLIDQKAVLVSPSDCIGHGACKAACPQDAIRLVFGSSSRPVEIPDLTPLFETSVPGIFVAGELGGMGLVKNAIEQGKQAMDSIVATLGNTTATQPDWDTVIVGCGPAGISAALQARLRGIRALTLERGRIGGTVAHFPRAKMVMTAPAELPGVGPVRFSEIRKEDLITFWRQVVEREKPLVHESENLLSIEPLSRGGFDLHTDKASYRTRTVLLAMGRRGVPRKLEIPGEEMSKVVYELEDAAQYTGKRIIVVGGGDSALEAAIACVDSSAAQVAIVYRGETFNRAKRANRARIDKLIADEKVGVYFQGRLTRIKQETVELEQAGIQRTIPNDHVIICAGGVLPTEFLRSLGIRVVKKYGEA